MWDLYKYQIILRVVIIIIIWLHLDSAAFHQLLRHYSYAILVLYCAEKIKQKHKINNYTILIMVKIIRHNIWRVPFCSTVSNKLTLVFEPLIVWGLSEKNWSNQVLKILWATLYIFISGSLSNTSPWCNVLHYTDPLITLWPSQYRLII